MRTETRAVQRDVSDEVSLPADAGATPTTRRMPYKSLFAVLVIGVLTLGAQGLLVVGGTTTPVGETAEPLSGTQVDPEAMPGDVAPVHPDQDLASIERKLMALSDLVERRFETLQGIVVEGRRTLSALAEQMQATGVTITDLANTDQNLAQRLGETTQRLEALAGAVQTFTVEKRKRVVPKPPLNSTQPPFDIDGIDRWDDQTYVVVSQAGQVAFLKAGDRQSGWTVTQVDPKTGKVQFTGPEGQTYSVSLAR